jgi:N-acetylglucosamine kinase-like BadF-type ATPase
LTEQQVVDLLQKELLPSLGKAVVEKFFYYGTGLRNPANAKMLQNAFKRVFKKTRISLNDDMVAAARGLNGHKKGITCNLGTGSFACFYDGKKIAKKAPGIGYILGDEGSGAYLGKKLIQYYLYGTLDEELRYRFEDKYKTTAVDILENVYRKPLANRYLASFCPFLADNRGHYMVENIVEDGLNDFFFYHLCKFNESWKMPIHFVGSVAYSFRDVLQELCNGYEFEMGKILKSPMAGLLEYHS